MGISTDATALLEALSEPALLVGEDGVIIHMNRAAAAAAGELRRGVPLSVFDNDESRGFHAYLNRCFGSRQPLVGAIAFGESGALRRFQCRGSLVTLERRRAVLLRLSRVDEERFAALTRKVEELNRELGERQRAKAVLEETLRERELLLRELQHRVKNNMHMLAAMLLSAEHEATSEEARSALRGASLRFSAVSAVQQLLYGSDSLEAVGSEALVSTLTRAALSMAPQKIESEVHVDPVDLPIDAAIPIALAMNELLTNSIKYGTPAEGKQKIRIEFVLRTGQIHIAVEDNGAGFTATDGRKRASGIGLVRGLLRQLGGSFSVEQEHGSRCVLRFPDPRSRPGRSMS